MPITTKDTNILMAMQGDRHEDVGLCVLRDLVTVSLSPVQCGLNLTWGWCSAQ